MSLPWTLHYLKIYFQHWTLKTNLLLMKGQWARFHLKTVLYSALLVMRFSLMRSIFSYNIHNLSPGKFQWINAVRSMSYCHHIIPINLKFALTPLRFSRGVGVNGRISLLSKAFGISQHWVLLTRTAWGIGFNWLYPTWFNLGILEWQINHYISDIYVHVLDALFTQGLLSTRV